MKNPEDVFHELGDPTRLRVLLSIIDGRKNVSAIVTELGLSQPQVSYHLRKLKDVGLAVEEKDGRWVWYQAHHGTEEEHLRELLDLMSRWAGGRRGGSSERRGAAGPGSARRPRGAGVMRKGRRPKARREPGARREDEDRPRVDRPARPADEMEDFLL